jgi:ribonucleoside-diphosphate reductase alpha chain
VTTQKIDPVIEHEQESLPPFMIPVLPWTVPARKPEQETNMSSAPLPYVENDQTHLPGERTALTHKFTIGGEKGYVIAGLYDDGRPGEIRIVMGQHGSTVSGLLGTISKAVSLGLQHGVPMHVFVDKFSHSRFEPQGFTGNADIPIAKSVVDYVFRWLGSKFVD